MCTGDHYAAAAATGEYFAERIYYYDCRRGARGLRVITADICDVDNPASGRNGTGNARAKRDVNYFVRCNPIEFYLKVLSYDMA